MEFGSCFDIENQVSHLGGVFDPGGISYERGGAIQCIRRSHRRQPVCALLIFTAVILPYSTLIDRIR